MSTSSSSTRHSTTSIAQMLARSTTIAGMSAGGAAAALCGSLRAGAVRTAQPLRAAALRARRLSSEAGEPEKRAPSVLVLGGNGFVGSAVCSAALDAGLRVSSLSRSGRPGWVDKLDAAEQETHWAGQVEWKSGDVFVPADLEAAMGGSGCAAALPPPHSSPDLPPPVRRREDRVDAVVSTIGAFGNYETMVRMCGQATVGAVEVADRLEVPRFVFISAHDYGFPVRSLVKGYYVK